MFALYYFSHWYESFISFHHTRFFHVILPTTFVPFIFQRSVWYNFSKNLKVVWKSDSSSAPEYQPWFSHDFLIFFWTFSHKNDHSHTKVTMRNTKMDISTQKWKFYTKIPILLMLFSHDNGKLYTIKWTFKQEKFFGHFLSVFFFIIQLMKNRGNTQYPITNTNKND